MKAKDLLPLLWHELDPEHDVKCMEETDAAVIIVSEESGGISLAMGGDLERLADRNRLEDRLMEYLKK